MAGRSTDFGQAKISQQSPPAIYENITRFDIAVNDIPLVSVVERVGDLDDVIDQALKRSAFLYQVPQRPGVFYVAHNQIAIAVMHAKVVNFQDVGVMQTRSGVRLSLEALGKTRFQGQLGGQDFYGYIAVQARLVSLKNPSHAALPDFLYDFVLA